jgi:hypothetical protein
VLDGTAELQGHSRLHRWLAEIQSAHINEWANSLGV